MQFGLFGKFFNRMVPIGFSLFLLVPALLSGEAANRENTSQETTRGGSSGLKNLYHSLFQSRGYSNSSFDSSPSKQRIPEVPEPEDIKNLQRTRAFIKLTPDISEHFDSQKSDEKKEDATEIKKDVPEIKEIQNIKVQKNIERDNVSVRGGVEPKSEFSILSEFPTVLTPLKKEGYVYRSPEFYKGLYLTNHTIRSEKRYIPILKEASEHGLNVLVIDVQDRMPGDQFIKFARENNFYIIARIVVFPGGLKQYPPSLEHIVKIIDLAEESARKGFMEIQFDYIRFADELRGKSKLQLTLKKRYRLIAGILKMATERLRPLGVRVGADVFGRIAFNRDDIIGQKVELFAKYVDTLYPMLYPSHFYGEPDRIQNPYKTVLEGKKNCIRRVDDKTRVVAYIQGFGMSVAAAGLTLEKYILKQIKAAEDSGGAGYVVWNARNQYGPFFKALKSHSKGKINSVSGIVIQPKKIIEKNLPF